MVAGEDYIFNFAKIEEQSGVFSKVYSFSEGKKVFDGPVPSSYAAFRENWILLRRLRPKVQCPENTPLPIRRISKDARARILSIYLRPWTLSRKMATADVPFLLDLAKAPAGMAHGGRK